MANTLATRRARKLRTTVHLPVDNAARLTMERPHRSLVYTLEVARQARLALEHPNVSEMFPPDLLEEMRLDTEAVYQHHHEMIASLCEQAHAELVARQAEHHRLLAELARTLEDTEPAEAARIHHHEPRPAPPPGAELVAVVSLAPHAPPAEARLHASPEGVT